MQAGKTMSIIKGYRDCSSAKSKSLVEMMNSLLMLYKLQIMGNMDVTMYNIEVSCVDMWF